MSESMIHAFAGTASRFRLKRSCSSEAVSVLMRMNYDLESLSTEIPWRRIHNFGNVLRHSYPEVEEDLVANIVIEHLPRLRAVAAAEVERLDRETET